MTEYFADIRERGKVTIPKELRERYNMKSGTKVKLIPKVGGILIKPQIADPLRQLKGLAEGLWPDKVSSVNLIRELRRRADFQVREKL